MLEITGNRIGFACLGTQATCAGGLVMTDAAGLWGGEAEDEEGDKHLAMSPLWRW